jgi:hypothetical protein
MGKLVAIAVGVLVLIAIGGGAFLMMWDIPAPTTQVSRVIPDARFPR